MRGVADGAGRRCPRAGRRRPRPTGRCACSPDVPAARDSRACNSSPMAGRAAARTGWSDARNSASRRARLARQAAEDEQPGVRVGDRRQSGFDGLISRIRPTSAGRAAQRPPHRPVLGQLQLCARRRQPGAQPAGRLSAAAGRKVRVYSPTVEHPAFPATGDLVSVPRSRSRAGPNIACRSRCRRASAATSPNSRPTWSTSPAPISSPTARSAGRGGAGSPAVASVHTRFETYLAYYGLQILEPTARAIMRRLYRRCEGRRRRRNRPRRSFAPSG